MITQEVINENLEHAIDNGYFLDLSQWTVAEIAHDLVCYSVDCENSSVAELTPFVKSWYDARLLGEGDMVTQRIVTPSIVGSTPTPPAKS